MYFRLLLLGFLVLLGMPLWALPPDLINPASSVNIIEQGLLNLAVIATDPDGDPLDYSWSFEDDPTGAAFFKAVDGTQEFVVSGKNSQVKVGLGPGPNYPDPSFVGQTILVKVDVSDGTEITSHTFQVNVVGVNLPPDIVVDESDLGTQQDPKLDGEGLTLDASASSDPVGGSVKFFWQITGISGGSPCTGSLVLFGKETDQPGLVVPRVSAVPSSPMRIFIEMIVEDGLITIKQTFTGYMASQGGCSGGANQSPIVNASASPSSASFGQTVTLIGSASDPDGDNMTFSWLQLSTTGGEAVALSNPQGLTTTFSAPSQTKTLTFQFTATDSRGGSGSDTVSVPVSASGGGSGGGGGGSSGGVAAGVTVCSDSGNQPAVATVPATVTVEAGKGVVINAVNGTDPDNTEAFVSGLLLKGVSYSWAVETGAGVTSLTGTQTASLSFTAPQVSQDKTFSVTLDVSDPKSCGTRYTVQVTVTAPDQPVETNDPPVAGLTYQLEDGPPLAVPSQAVEVTAPVTVVLDASSSTDDGSLTFSFALKQNLVTGGALLSQVSSAVRQLQIQSGSSGTVTVTMTASDDKGATDSLTIDFVVSDVAQVPVAAAAVMLGEQPLGSGENAEEGAVVTLDGTGSSLPDGTRPESLSFAWRQIDGPPVSLVGLDQQVARFRVPDLDGETTSLVFELRVSNGSETSDPVSISVPVQVAPLFFSQVAFGPVVDQVFRTVLVLINNQEVDAPNVTIDFFDQNGEPLQVSLGGEPWDSSAPFALEASSSRILRFSAQDETTTVGWARVDSDVRINGLVLYQLLDGVTGDLTSEVSLFSSGRGTLFTTFFDPNDGLAVAIANPGEEEAKVNVKIIDPEFGPDLPVATRPLVLKPGEQLPRFLDASYFGLFPEGFQTGTLEIEAVQGRVIATVLKTRGGLPISTLPLASRR
ncbi:MAG: Ig-like domain-containing protein [Acidobacteriota bacterium]